jgi:hypothetical protein
MRFAFWLINQIANLFFFEKFLHQALIPNVQISLEYFKWVVWDSGS